MYNGYVFGSGIWDMGSVRMVLTGQNRVWVYALLLLSVLAALLLLVLYVIRCRTVRIYNWNGKGYRCLGRAVLHRSGDGYVVRIGERMADLSYTTRYRICPSTRFVRKNRYKRLVLCAGRARSLLYVDRDMSRSIYFCRQ